MTTDPLMVGVSNGAKRLGCGRDALYELVRTGRVRSIRIGRTIRIPVAELEAFIQRELAEQDRR